MGNLLFDTFIAGTGMCLRTVWIFLFFPFFWVYKNLNKKDIFGEKLKTLADKVSVDCHHKDYKRSYHQI